MLWLLTICNIGPRRMEELKLRSPSGIAKLTGVALCLAGVLVIALYAGELLSAVNHHHAFVAAPTHAASATAPKTLMGATWIKGTFMAVLGCSLPWHMSSGSSCRSHQHLQIRTVYININVLVLILLITLRYIYLCPSI